MKDRCMRFRAVLLAALIVLGTALLAGPVSARADALPSTDAETAASGQPSREPNEPAPDGTIYNTVQHFLYHVASRDPYSFYSTIPCTGELRECIGYLLDAWQSQGVDFVSRFNLHPSASYPYANVRHFCAQLDAELSAGDTVDVPCGSGALTFLFQKYDTTEAAYRAGAFDLAGTLGLVTASNETYGHCWLSLGRFSPSISENDMRAWLENYYKLGDGALSGTIATGDANKVWKAYAEGSVWRVHGARWSETTHGGCIVDNIPTASTSLQNAPCYVLIPTSDAEPAIAQGDLELQLSSALPAVTNGNANYALGSASLGIYADAACTKQLATAVTDAEGRAKVHHLASQTVYVKLKTTPYGYETAAAAPVRIPESGAASLTIPLTPSLIRTQISVQPQASSAPLAGAVFTIRYYACTELKYLSEAVLKGVWTVTMGADGVRRRLDGCRCRPGRDRRLLPGRGRQDRLPARLPRDRADEGRRRTVARRDLERDRQHGQRRRPCRGSFRAGRFACSRHLFYRRIQNPPEPRDRRNDCLSRHGLALRKRRGQHEAAVQAHRQ